MIFSHVKNNMVVLFYFSFRITSVVFIVALTDADPTSIFLNCSNFSVSEQNNQVLVFIFLIRM